MSNIEQALKSLIEALEYHTEQTRPIQKTIDTIAACKSALSDIEKCEPVAEALHERNRLGYAVVDVIGALDEIIENAQEVEVDDFLHIAIPIDKWHELQDALEEMPKRAELYTSSQPIEKCEPVAWLRFYSYQNDMDYDEGFEIVDKYKARAFPVYTSPISKEWVGLTDKRIEEIAKRNGAWQLYSSLKIFDFVANINDELKQLNVPEKG